MQTILHTDYWIEIPAGKYVTGISPSQLEACVHRIREQIDYSKIPSNKKLLLEDAVAKLRKTKLETQHLPYIGLYRDFTQEQLELDYTEPFSKILKVESFLLEPLKTVWLDKFYIARFPITEFQYELFKKGTLASNLPGAFEEPTLHDKATNPSVFEERKRYGLSSTWPGRVVTQYLHVNNRFTEFCNQLGARLPTIQEWEKAARGIDGRLYPWGNEWDSQAGYFYAGQENGSLAVDAYPRGVSPYGVWYMAGGLEELAELVVEGRRQVIKRGCHPNETTPDMAWFDHIVTLGGKGIHSASLRPVLDKWPIQQWQGHTFTDDQTS